MSVALYDKMLVEKLRKWTKKTQINVYGPSETRRLFEVIEDKTNDEPIKLPIICLTRPGGYTIENPNKKPMTYDGLTLFSDENSSLQLNAIPIIINYQLDVYTRFLEEADAYVRDIIFNIINHSTFEVNIPYNDTNIIHKANIRVSNEVEDNSNVPERLIPGQFTRLTLNVTLDDAYIWDSRVRSNVYISAEGLLVKNNNDDEFTVEKI